MRNPFEKLKAALDSTHHGELLRGSSSAFMVRLFGIAVAYVFTIIVTRGFGAEAMGVFALAYTVLQIASVVGRAGLDSALLRFTAEYTSQGKHGVVKDVYRKGLASVLVISLLLSALLFALAPQLAALVFKKSYLSSYFRAAAIGILPMSLLFLNAEAMRGLKKTRIYTFLTQASIFLFSSVILVVLMQFASGMWVPVTVFIIALFIAAGLSFGLWKRHAGLGPVERSKELSLGNIFNVSFPLMLASSLTFIMNWTDTIMLGMYRTEGEVGIYAVAIRIAKLTALTLFAVNVIAAPKFAELFGKKDFATMADVARNSTRLIFWTSFPILVCIFLFPGFILWIFGKEFQTGSTALLLLAAGQFINATSGSVGAVLKMTGKQHILQNIILTATIMNIILNYLLIPRYGINGAAFASMISVSFWNLSSVFFVKKYFGFWTFYLPIPRKRHLA